MHSSFLVPKILAKVKQGHPNGGAKCRWGRLNAGAVLSSRSVHKFITVSVHHICFQHVRRDAARRAGLSATADPCSLTGNNSVMKLSRPIRIYKKLGENIHTCQKITVEKSCSRRMTLKTTHGHRVVVFVELRLVSDRQTDGQSNI